MARILLIAAHPDDETIGAGVLLHQGRDIAIVHVTDGSPRNLSDAHSAGFATRECYALARAHEAARALQIAGISEASITTLGFLDQEVSFHLEELTANIRNLIEHHHPQIVLTHAYEGGHPDHDSVAFASHCACRNDRTRLNHTFEFGEVWHGRENLDASHVGQAPALFEFTSYHAGPGGSEVYKFIDAPNSQQHCFRLNAQQRALKIQMLQAFRTQAMTLIPFMQPKCEIFRPAPHYDFTQAPHDGRLYFENFNWGIDGAKWRQLAAEAMSATCS